MNWALFGKCSRNPTIGFSDSMGLDRNRRPAQLNSPVFSIAPAVISTTAALSTSGLHGLDLRLFGIIGPKNGF
jgi:hypothetical protein